jgi:hypothetical protein
MLNENPQEREFAAGQCDLLTVPDQSAALGVELKRPETVACRRYRFLRLPVPAQHCTDPGQQFAGIERLGQVIVGTHLQPNDPVDLLATSR